MHGDTKIDAKRGGGNKKRANGLSQLSLEPKWLRNDDDDDDDDDDGGNDDDDGDGDTDLGDV